MFDKYPNDEEHIFMSPCLKFYSDDLFYDSYEFESGGEDDSQLIQIAEELSPLLRIDDKKNSYEPIFEMYESELQGYSAKEEICEKNEEQSLHQSILLSEESMCQPILKLKAVLSKSPCRFVDPIADYMEFSFLKVSLSISLGVLLIHNSKYESHLEIILHTFQPCSSGCEDMPRN